MDSEPVPSLDFRGLTALGSLWALLPHEPAYTRLLGNEEPHAED